ncbi:MAG: hypothetical protein RQ760_20980 [Sedimentisphaerales bacterium]|nr:hypothetical protein [Sedimentisphaerales bacterium]
MKEPKDEKWLDETISRATDLGRVKFDAEKWREKYILNKLHKQSQANFKPKPQYNIWRIIMESKVTRYSAVAVVALAAALVLFSPFSRSKNGGVVLADVQQKVADIETMIIRGTKTFTYSDKDGEILEMNNGFKADFDLVKYVSKQHGLVEEGYVGDKLVYRITFNRPNQQTLLVIPPAKKYGKMASTDKQMLLLENLSPKGIMNLLLGGEHQKLGRETINGVEVEVFEFQDTEPFKEIAPKVFIDIKSLKGKVWIGIEEQLPVRVEGDFLLGKSFGSMFNELNLHEVNTFHDYHIKLDEDIFDTKAPEGYTELNLSDFLQFIPVEVKAGVAGLGLCFFIIPAGFIVRKRNRRKKVMAKQD